MTLFLFQFLLKSFFQKQFFSCLQKVAWAEHLVPRALPPWAEHLVPRALPPWAEHLVPRALPPWAEHLVPRALKKNIINNLPFHLPFFTYLLCFVVFFWMVGFRRSFEYVLAVIAWMFFCCTFPFSFHLFCCWVTLRNLALGKFSFCLPNLLFFTKFKSVNFF